MTSDEIHDLAVHLLDKPAGALDVEQVNVFRNIQRQAELVSLIRGSAPAQSGAA